MSYLILYYVSHDSQYPACNLSPTVHTCRYVHSLCVIARLQFIFAPVSQGLELPDTLLQSILERRD